MSSIKKPKLLVMDVDGTLTDGKIYMGTQGELLKAFHIKDGLMIARLSGHNVIPVILTGRTSEITANRCKELGISEIYQGHTDKMAIFQKFPEIYHCSFEDIAYIGDDINDLACMKLCGLTGCPEDAADEIKEISTYQCKKRGGEGAVRDFIDWFLKESR